MYNFRNFIIEAKAANEEKLTHLEHAEDHVLNAGHDGFRHALSNLMDVHHRLTGGKNDTKVTMKYDGSPSVVFGRNPDNGKFFVASKSAFNVNPKINYNEKDIEDNHGHAPGLVTKLKYALKHLPKVTPKEGVFQGDIMHTEGDVELKGPNATFKPNTIQYATPIDSEHGQKAVKSKIGVAVHTAYRGGNLAGMKAEYGPDLSKEFGDHPDVHLISTDHDLKKIKYSPKHQEEFQKHIDNAQKAFAETPYQTYDAVEPHTINLKTYINSTVRDGSKPSADGYKKWLGDRHTKALMDLKSPAGRSRKQLENEAKMKALDADKHHIQAVLNMHGHLQKAKDVLTHVLSSNSEFDHYINGKKAKPEGFVVIKNNRPTKFVDRSEFSRANFAPRVAAESTFIGAGAIRGVGQATGSPTAGDDDTLQYINSNVADSDVYTKAGKGLVTTFHMNLHKRGKNK